MWSVSCRTSQNAGNQCSRCCAKSTTRSQLETPLFFSLFALAQSVSLTSRCSRVRFSDYIVGHDHLPHLPRVHTLSKEIPCLCGRSIFRFPTSWPAYNTPALKLADWLELCSLAGANGVDPYNRRLKRKVKRTEKSSVENEFSRWIKSSWH